jgi:hypothetical protein
VGTLDDGGGSGDLLGALLMAGGGLCQASIERIGT